jgi:predicted DNA-binding transcriptional regulator AlpA
MSEPDHPLGDDWLTIGDIAARLDVREATIRGWLSRGRFPEPDGRVGPSNVWRREAVEAWAARRPRKGKPGTFFLVLAAAGGAATQLDHLSVICP